MAKPRLLFLTGHLARPRLERILAGIGETAFDWAIADIGVKVAALATGDIIERRLQRPVEADRVVLPGRCRADLARLEASFGVPFVRGPDELVDLPEFLGRKGGPPDLSRHAMRIFAEIVDATAHPVETIVARAEKMRGEGADVIDLGCLPDTPFPHLEEMIAGLKAAGHTVSVDSADPDELSRATRAGADYLLSLNEETMHIAREGDAVPILVPAIPHDLASLDRAIETARAMGIDFIADAILDPIHFGFTASLLRYHELRRRHPDISILMGTGNLTELTDADTSGITATLLGICSELSIDNLLIVNVSPHTRATIAEHDAARRMLFAAKEDNALPRGYSSALLQVHDVKPFAVTPGELGELAATIKDRNYRIETAEDGIHLFNRDMHHVATDAFELFPHIEVDGDTGHAFYLGAELQKAEVAFRLGKRYAQDAPLDFGVGAPRNEEDRTRLEEAGHTLKAQKNARRTSAAKSADDDGEGEGS
ncbi:dihydropteroate synthase [Jiella sp. KSK16Y-1]|uniref:Dihydropteroate synthase n=2 Tax=Jiella mangrovi TaxID=2821407 RepID=A0ABS4BF56_9HYPH|nr:dihydropteroate synthase [Jiella mangrovi]